jgi:hypothetical protein
MKRKTLKIYSKVGGLLSEAMRRIYCMGSRPVLGSDKNLDYKFAGLGSPSMYKDGVKAGLFVPSYPPETPRVANWYRLTPLGQKVVKQMVRKGRMPKDCHDMNNHVPFIVTVYVEE